MGYVIPLQYDPKKTLFCMSSKNVFLEDGIQDNNWVSNSIIKLVDAVDYHKIKKTRVGNSDESENFEMEIPYEGQSISL